MRAIHFLVIFSLIFNFQFSLAAETSDGKKSSTASNRKPSSSATAEPDVQLKKGKCPTPLKEAVLDDYQDKSTLLVFKFNSEAKTCNTSVSSYQNYMSGKGMQTNYQTPDALSAELSKQFAKTISPNMARTLNGCNTSADMTPEQAKVAHTRFYAAATRIEKFNKSAVDELAFIDSITEGGAVLEGIECSPLLPELKSNCENLRNAGGQCKAQSANRFDEQLQKTMDNIGKIEALKVAEDKCKTSAMVKCAGATKDCPTRGGYTFTSQKIAAKKCENIGKAIEILKDEVPWVRGEIFDKIAREPKKPRSSVRNYLSREKIKEGMREQLKANRTALASAYKDNLQNFRCLMYDTNDKGEKCDFAKVRTELAKLDAPTIPQLEDRRANMELKTYFDAESCLLDRGEDRAGTKNIVDNAALDAGLTVLTAGLGSVAVGAKVIGGLSKTAITTRRGAFAGALGVDAYFAQGSAREAFKSCTQKTTAILDNLSVRDKQKNMVCDNAKSQVSVARETNNSCMVDALLASADLLPFMGAAAPLLARSMKAAPSAGTTTPGGGTPGGADVLPNAPKVDVAAADKPKPKPNTKPRVEQKPSEISTPPSVAVAKPTDARKPASNQRADETPVVASAEKTPVVVKEDELAPVQTTSRRIGPNDDASAVAKDTSAEKPNPEFAPENPNLTAAEKALGSQLMDVLPTARAKDPVVDTSLARIPTATGIGKGVAAAVKNIDSNQIRNVARKQNVQVTRADGEVVAGRVTGVHESPNGAEVEVAFAKADGSMSSRRLLAQEFFQTNPKVRDALDKQFYEFMSGKKQASNVPPVKAPTFAQTNTAAQTFVAAPKSAALDMRGGTSNNSAMAVAAAPARPTATTVQTTFNQPVVAQRAQAVNLQPEIQNFGNSAPIANVQQAATRAPASQGYSAPVQTSQSAEDELVQALSRGNTGAAAPSVAFAKAKPAPVSFFKNNGDGSQASGINAKADNTPTTYVDTSDNVRFIEGEQIKISNFEGGKDAEFKIVKKLDNGLLRVSDNNGKEFDLLRDEVKTAERLNPSAVASLGAAQPQSAKIKGWTNEIPEQVKLKEEFVRQGDNVSLKNFEGGSDLNASVVRKNTDGTVRVKDEAGKEFDLVKSEVKDAEFSRGLPTEVRQNLEISDEAARLKAAEDYLQKPLTDVQKQAVIESHKIADDKGIYALSKTDLRQKTKVLRDAGLSEDEASLLIRKGVTGSTGLDDIKIVADQAPVPKFEIVKGKQLEVPMGNTGRTNPGSVVSGPDARGFYEVEFYQKGAGVGRTRKSADELTAANVKLPSKVENPIINVPAVGKDVSYPGKVLSGPNAKNQYEVEIFPPGKPSTLVRIDGTELKKANTPQAVRQARIRDARRSSFANRSTGELDQILDDSLRQAESRGSRDTYNVSYGSSGQPDRTLKVKKIDIEGQRALEELARRQNKDVNELYEEVKLGRRTKPQVNDKTPTRNMASTDQSTVAALSAAPTKVVDPVEVAGDARNRLDYLAQQDRLNSSRMSERQRESVARELGIYDSNKTAALDYGSVGTKKETRELFEKLFPGKKEFDTEMLRSSMSFNPRGGYIGNAEFANAEKFVQAVQKADIDGSTLSLSERRLLNKFTDRAPLYARQVNPEVAAIPRQSLEAVVPPRITNNKVTTMATRGDEVVEQVKIKPDMVRPGDQVIVKDFEGGADLDAYFVKRNTDGTIRVKDSQGKEFNLGAQATSESQFYRGLTAELKVNGDLDNPSRVKAAEAYIKRSLTAAQKNAVIASHNVGGEGRGYFDYTAKELKEKTEILRKAGFSNTEATLLIRKGVTGNNPTEISNLIKVTPSEVRVGDQVVIQEFNGTGEIRGQITGPANNGGLILREANGVETIVYKSDLEDLTNSQITRNPNTRTIAAAEDLSLKRAPIVAVKPKKVFPVEPQDVRAGDKVIISEFNGTGELEGVVVGTKKDGSYLLREANGQETIVYKTDLEDATNTRITREPGIKLPAAKFETQKPIDNSPDSPLLVSKDKKLNPDIAVPLGNGELRQGRVLSQVEPKPGLPKAYVVEYVDEVGVTSQVRLTQEELLAANTPKALEKVKADRQRSAEYQSKSDKELQQLLDEGNRAAKEAVGKGRAVDKPDLSGEAQSALSELARRNNVTSSAVFEAYRRGGVKGLENLAVAQKVVNSPSALVPVTPIIAKPLAQLKTGDYVVTAGIGDKVKLPKANNSDAEGVVLARDKDDGQVIYTVAFKNADGRITTKKMTDRELGDANSAFVGIRVEPSRRIDPQSIRAKIEDDFKNARNEEQLAELRRKATLKVAAKNKVTYDDSKNPLLENSNGVMTPDGAIFINVDRSTDERFSTLLHEVSHTKTDKANGNISVQSDASQLTTPGYSNGFFTDEIKAATVNFAVDKQTVIAQAKAGKLGIPNKAVKREIDNMQLSVDRRQGFINDMRESLDQVDESLGTLMSKSVNYGDQKYTTWQVTLNNVQGQTAPVFLTFNTPINLSRSEAMGQLRELSREERIKLLNSQARLDYDKVYLAELRTKVGVPKPPEPLNGPGVFQVAEAKEGARNVASGIKAQAAAENKATQNLVNELEGVIGERGRAKGLRNTSELTAGHPLTPVIEKQRQIINRLSHTDRELEPENFARISTNVANDLLKSGDVDLALPYYRLAAETVENNLGTTAKSFWASEANTKAAIKAGFIADNQELAHMATQKLVLSKTKGNSVEEVKKVALDQFYNLGYEYDKVLYGIKRYGNKNKELELLVIRKQQQHIAKKYGLTKEIESSIGKESFDRIDNQADLTVDDLVQNPQQIIDPDKFKKTQRVPAGGA